MRHLNLVYDPACGLCTHVKEWLQRQPVYVPLFLIPAGSPQALKLFPRLDQLAGSDELLAVNDQGGVYVGNHAWIMCLWALRDYRRWAFRLATPALLPVARQAFDVLSSQRALVSRIFGLASEREMADQLRQVAGTSCSIGR